LAVAAGLAATIGVLAPSASAASKSIPAADTLRLEPISFGQGHPASGEIAVPILGAPPAVYAREKAAAAARAQAEARAHPRASQTRASAFSTALADVFNGLNAPGYSAASQLAAGGPGLTPPDSTGAIGPSDYIELVNARIVDFNSTDLSLKANADLSTFVSGTAACDPQIKYDPTTSRWFYVAIRCDGTASANTLYFGFSKETNPANLTTDWCRYAQGTTTAFQDYPKLGVDGTHIMIGVNEFAPSFDTARIFVYPEPTAGTIGTSCPAENGNVFGSSGTPLQTSLGDAASTPEPATVADNSGKGYVVAADMTGGPFSGDGSHIMVWQVTGTAAPFTLTPIADPSVTAFSLPANIPQPAPAPANDPIDASDSRLTNAVAANDPGAGDEAVWTEHTVDSGSGGTLVRWYELVPGASSVIVRQQGSVTDPSGWVFNGAIAPTTSGGAVINYNVGGPSQQVQVKAQSRIPGAPLGTMNSPTTLASSSDVDVDFSCPSVSHKSRPCRWGDYSAASLDPSNGSVVWGTNMFNGPQAGTAPQWATENFALTPTDVAPTASFTSSGTSADTPVSFNGTSSSDVDGTIASYSWSFGDGTTATGATPTHVYGKGGTYTVTLTVTDDGSKTSVPATNQVTVTDEPPTASFTSKPSGPGTGQPVTFNASASKDPDGSIVSHAWNFGDGATSSSASPKHVYKKPGKYMVTLGVADSNGLMNITSRQVTVKRAGISRLKIAHKTSSGATLLVTVNAPGTLTVGRAHKHVRGAGTVKFKLSSNGILTLKVAVEFKPAVGKAATKTLTIKF
jgi:PKD repeat protein